MEWTAERSDVNGTTESPPPRTARDVAASTGIEESWTRFIEAEFGDLFDEHGIDTRSRLFNARRVELISRIKKLLIDDRLAVTDVRRKLFVNQAQIEDEFETTSARIRQCTERFLNTSVPYVGAFLSSSNIVDASRERSPFMDLATSQDAANQIEGLRQTLLSDLANADTETVGQPPRNHTSVRLLHVGTD